MLVDSATIYVRSGRGGDGCVSFRREKYVPKGGPDGGDGGDGGAVVLLAARSVDTLLDFAGRHHWRADAGKPGEGGDRHGRDGRDLVIELPAGTQVYDDESGELVADLDEVGKRCTVAEGGRGGRGNAAFAGPTHQTPREFEHGGAPVERTLRLELKLIADVGLVGLPNAGKSTLLSRVTRATPKIADYPFTTLEPQLGIAELDPARRIVFADIPGLIEKAHEGAGLGTRFLRHVERTRVLLHVLEPEPHEGDVGEHYRMIREELRSYAPALADKPELIAVSKVDTLGDAEDAETARQLVREAIGKDVIPISAASGHGLNELLEACWALLNKDREPDEGWPAPLDPTP